MKIVKVAVGKHFAVIPKAALAGIVIVNLRGMFRQFLELPPIWKYSKYFSIHFFKYKGSEVLKYPEIISPL